MTDVTIEALKLRRRELEINEALTRGAIDEISSIIAEMERRRGGRPRKPVIVQNERPDGVPGGIHQVETDEHLFPEDAA